MSIIVNGNKIADKILADLKPYIAKLKEKKIQPTLAVVLVGEDSASKIYVKKKKEAAQKINIKFLEINFSESVSKNELISEIQKIQIQNNLNGLIVQLPLPKKLRPYTREILDQINLEIDIDCLSSESLGKLICGENKFLPPTAGAILEILKYHKIDLIEKNVCVIGRGLLVGKPLVAILLNEPVVLSIHGKSTKNLSSFTKEADILIVGAGQKNIVTGKMVKKDVIIIDAGICCENNKVCGDIDFDSLKNKASLITPVPGGVGPITVAKLLNNVVVSAKSPN